MHTFSVIVAALLATAYATASKTSKASKMYNLKVTNLTYRQPLSPVLAVAHTKDIQLFEEGEEASAGLRMMAENGNNTALAVSERIILSKYICGYVVGTTPIAPGDSFEADLEVSTEERCKYAYFSTVSMLVNTNDAFMGVQTEPLPWYQMTWYPPAFDAGTEVNNEDCGFIPGPGCNDISMENKPDYPGEGFIHVHRGMHDMTTDLPAATYDWRNGVALVSLTKGH
ncbi:unnamed protein product [Discosporangium mesarthrocarpum]